MPWQQVPVDWMLRALHRLRGIIPCLSGCCTLTPVPSLMAVDSVSWPNDPKLSDGGAVHCSALAFRALGEGGKGRMSQRGKSAGSSFSRSSSVIS